MLKDILEIITDTILYFPRKIAGHFKYIHDLEKENAELEIAIHERDLLFKGINSIVEKNSYGNEQLKLCQIKELASTFPNDNTSSNSLF